MAKQLSNPVAALISVPFQLNYDEHFGAAENGHKWTLNVQPVVPISLNADWNLISRTILPIVDQKDVVPGSSQSGIGGPTARSRITSGRLRVTTPELTSARLSCSLSSLTPPKPRGPTG